MAALGKIRLFEQLVGKEWTPEPEHGPYALKPPASLIAALQAATFHVYDAADLQAFIEPNTDEH